MKRHDPMPPPTPPMQPSGRRHRVTRPVRLGPPARGGRTLGLLLAVLALAGTPAFAGGEGLQWADAQGGWTTQFALETHVGIDVVGMLAEVVVTQRYVNESDQWREGRYLLPLPPDAAVGTLALRIGERLVEGEVREKQAAREAYQQAASAGQRAALVEASRPNLFRTAVANVAPGEAIEVSVGYWQPVEYRDGGFSLTLPLTLTPRYHPATGCAPDCDGHPEALPVAIDARRNSTGLEPLVSIQARIDAGIPLAYVGSPTHQVEVTPDGGHYQVELGRLVERSDRDFELRWHPRPSAVPQRAVFVESLDDGHHLQLMLLPPTLPVDPLPRELILVIDNSGSMHGASMQQAIAALDDALSRLREDDMFNIVRFNHTAQALFPEPVMATAGNVREARRFVARLRAHGGTELRGALELAFQGRPRPGLLRQVVLATDAAIGNERALFSMIEHDRGDARLFPVGIGSAPNGYFLRRAAELGRGSETTIRDTGDVARAMARLFDRLDRPAMRDIELHWPGLAEAFPHPLPDLYAGEPLRLAARVEALEGVLVVRGHTPHGIWQDALPLAAARPARGPGRLWATARVRALEDRLRDGAPEDEVRGEVLATALEHQIVSRFTSLVAIERTPVRPSGEPLDSTAFVNATPHGSLAFAQGSTGLRRSLGLALALALLATALWRQGE